jgi:hypothetical protein
MYRFHLPSSSLTTVTDCSDVSIFWYIFFLEETNFVFWLKLWVDVVVYIWKIVFWGIFQISPIGLCLTFMLIQMILIALSLHFKRGLNQPKDHIDHSHNLWKKCDEIFSHFGFSKKRKLKYNPFSPPIPHQK